MYSRWSNKRVGDGQWEGDGGKARQRDGGWGGAVLGRLLLRRHGDGVGIGIGMGMRTTPWDGDARALSARSPSPPLI